MKDLLLFSFLFPLVSFIFSIFLPKNEKIISNWALFAAVVNLSATIFLLINFCLNSFEPIFINSNPIIVSHGYRFFIAIYLDYVSLIFVHLGSIVTFLITLYSRSYMHREEGYKRFFSTILFFYFGFNTVILAGNFESLMAGWEILGLSSFLLIGYYQNRFLPIKNSLKIFSIYRIGDIGLILAAWSCHILLEKNISFDQLSNVKLMTENLNQNQTLALFLAICIILAASVKSAQFPFFTWLPRAMEGPTPSSAIFYGSLSVHMGCYILIRTSSLWIEQPIARVLIFTIGLLTVFMCHHIARVQSSIKSQIAYSSLVQIGLIFIEISIGLMPLALIHLVANAFLRTYQLLISPSIVTYLIKEQFFDPKQNEHYTKNFSKIYLNKFYINSVKEWNLDHYHDKFLWHPLKVLGRAFTSLSLLKYFILMFSISGILLAIGIFNDNLKPIVTLFLTAMGLSFGLRAFAEKNNALLAWNLIFLNHIWVAISNKMLTEFNTTFYIYLSGILPSWFLGYFILNYLKSKKNSLHLNTHQGLNINYRKISFIFLICSLGISGFPISPSFIGEDLLFHQLHSNDIALAFLLSVTYILDGIATMRVYSRLFLGPNQEYNLDYSLKSA